VEDAETITDQRRQWIVEDVHVQANDIVVKACGRKAI
jgi:hypothetical protein